MESQRHLTVLMGARLALSIASLVIALVLDHLGGNITISEWEGFYGAVALAFVATLVYRPLAGRIRRIRVFAYANIVLDLCLISLLVSFSGGSESVFTFLYVVVPVYASVLLSGRGAVACAALAGLAHAAVLLAERSGWLGAPSVPDPDAVLLMRWVVHTGALVLVAGLASFLVGELERAGEALDQRTTDLEQLRALHQHTVESLMSGLLTTDEEGRITSFNQEAERITGVAREAAYGLPMHEVLPGLEGLVEEGGVGRNRARMEYVNGDGERLHLGIGAYVLRDGEGVPVGHVVIFQDVSDVVEMELELRRSERLAAVGTFSASIAHEVRNPLAAISGAIQMLQARMGEASGEPARLMGIVEREVDRLNQLITDFLAYARPAPLRCESVLLAELVADVAEMFDAGPEADVEVSIRVEEGLHVWADPAMVRQVLWNLLRNGADAMPSGGALRVEGRTLGPGQAQDGDSGGRMENDRKSAWAEISVLDQGTGIDPDIGERMFDPFFTTKRHGSGLGLPTVHRVVEEHGGSIRIERAAPPWSTAVRIRLPGCEARPGSEIGRTSEARP